MTYDARYAKQWHYARAKGILQWLPVDNTRAKVQQLADAGYTYTAIAAAVGVSGSAIRSIAGRHNATTNISRRLARRINNLTPAAVLAAIEDPDTLVPAIGAQRRVQAMQALGHTLADIDAATGARPRLAKYVADRAHGMSITFEKHTAIDRAYKALSGKPGRYARGRADAAARGYAPPLAWDGNDIDDPDATPNTGTVERRSTGGTGRPTKDVVDDIAWLLEHDPTLTAAQLAHRLGYSDRSGVQIALTRGNRPDLLARLARNAEMSAA